MAGQLEMMGFGIEQLARLSDSVERARGNSHSKDETLDQFFRFVERYECFTSLEIDLRALHDWASGAKAEAGQVEAAHKTTEIRIKTRTAAIELVERLLERGVGYGELTLWENMISGSRVVWERVTHQLQEFGSLDKARGKLEADAARLRTGTKASEARLSKIESAISTTATPQTAASAPPPGRNAPSTQRQCQGSANVRTRKRL